ncbi:hypothetical protein [Methylomonas koyamae]|uniref:hypothetical protein n=1 Tax=Methylomonas koyamae TaxID=702114 RepID=UPI0012F687C8|nr:hypothetical protein [Methylomonas koyamae]
MDESSLKDQPIYKIKTLFEKIATGTKHLVFKYLVIGPNSSATLRDILTEAGGCSSCKLSANQTDSQTNSCPKSMANAIDVTFYSAAATAADDQLMEGYDSNRDRCITAFSENINITLHRTTSTDQQLMKVLAEELRLRRIRDDEDVVILSEWDTFYGRSMRKTFERTWRGPSHQHAERNTLKVHYIGYMRGLDGMLPKSGEKTTDAKKQAAVAEKPDQAATIELAEGRSQKDYLRRLTDGLVKLDNDLKENNKYNGIAAIGILGSDVYDKLMILQALRDHFPHKLYFTTDLDALYTHPSKWLQTHNLLVAAPFGLNLHDELQGSIPQFRDSYQTALFLATQLSLIEEPFNQHQIPPRLFEIGRSQPIPLATSNDNFVTLKENEAGHTPKCSWKKWKQCKDGIQPEIRKTGLNSSRVYYIFVGVILVCLISWKVRKLAIRAVTQYFGRMVVFIVVFAALLFYFNCGYLTQIDAEPLYWLEGVSIWPSQLLRITAFLFATGFYCWGRCRLKRMQYEVHTIFNLLSRPDESVKGCDLLFVGSWKKEQDNINEESTQSKQWKWLFNPAFKDDEYFNLDVIFICAIVFLILLFNSITLDFVLNTPGRNALLGVLAVLAILFLARKNMHLISRKKC